MKEVKSDILVLFGGGMSDHLVKLKKELEECGENPVFGNYKDLIFQSCSDNQKIKLALQGIDLNQFKVIFFRLIGPRWEIITLINTYLNEKIVRKEVVLIDPLTESLKRFLGLKLSQVLALHQKGVRTPKTFWGYLEKIRNEVSEKIDFPIILKRSGASQGKEVYLAKNQTDLDKIIEKIMPQERDENKRFIAQEFIPNQGDLRILVLDNQVLGGIKRMRIDDEFRNNVSQGGKAEVIKKLSPELKEIAIKAASALQLSFAGVDIIKHQKTGKYYVLEVNRSPQFTGFMEATGMNVQAKLAEFLIRIKKEL